MESILIKEKPMAHQYSHPRIDAYERVTGLAKYGADWKLSDMLYGRIIMSTIPAGVVKRIDWTNASGIKGIITCLDDETIWNAGEREHKRHVFAKRVRFVGDCIGAVAAQTRNIAQEAVDAITVEYENEPAAVFTIKDSLAPNSSRIWDDDVSNFVGPLRYGFGDINKAFNEADFVYEADYSTARVHNAPMEPAISLAWWDENGKLTVVAATQSIFGCRDGLALDLGLSKDMVRVISLYKGGGFGNKNSSMNYDMVAALLARKTGKPVMVEYSRADDFIGVHGRWSSEQHLRAAVSRANSKITAIDLKAYCDIGAYTRHIKLGSFVNGAENYYSCNAWKTEVFPVYTNTPATAHMRAPTGPVANFPAESLADEIAHELKLDPLEFRLRNVVVKVHDHVELTNNKLKECLTIGAESFGWKRRWHPARSKAECLKHSLVKGVGLAMGSWHAFFPGPGEAIVKAKADGGFEVYVGVVDIGTGAKTTLAAIASKTLGVPIERIKLISGDTDTCPYSIGESGSRTTTYTGYAVNEAARKIKERILSQASSLLFTNREELEIRNERVVSKSNGGKSKEIALGEVIKSLGLTEIEERAVTAPVNPTDMERFSFTAHFAEVEVDTETGVVSVTDYLAAQESGDIINMITARSQVQGGVIMGIGMAMSENLLIDQNYGSILNPSFMNYRLPNHVAIPKIKVVFVEGDDSFGPKSVGETSIVPVAAAIGNAIFNATGARLRNLPFLPESVLRSIDPSLPT